MTGKNAYFTGKLQSSMVTGLMFARMHATSSSSVTVSRHFSEPAVFVAKVAKRQKNQLTFSCNRQQAHMNIRNIRNNRSFGKRKAYLFDPEYILIPEYPEYPKRTRNNVFIHVDGLH